MRTVVIGATGHIGSYLVPNLVESGHDVVALSRGLREPYRVDTAWDEVNRVTVDRDAEDAAGTFGGRVADLNADAVIDLMCFAPSSGQQLSTHRRHRTQGLSLSRSAPHPDRKGSSCTLPH
jgi:nucleoside-diphosphate-sugar epimerase